MKNSKNKSNLTIKDSQRLVDRWINQYQEGYWPVHAQLARLVEEVGELAREINHRFGPKPKKSTEQPADLGGELGNVLFTILALANSLDEDLFDRLGQVLAKYNKRDAKSWRKK